MNAAECSERTMELEKEYAQSKSNLNECTDQINSVPEYEKNKIELNKRIIELRNENKKLTQTRSTTGEYFLGILIFVGFVMFLYAVYISLHTHIN